LPRDFNEAHQASSAESTSGYTKSRPVHPQKTKIKNSYCATQNIIP